MNPSRIELFPRKFRIQFRTTVRAFKAARLCSPVQVQRLRQNGASLEELKNFPCIDYIALPTRGQSFPPILQLLTALGARVRMGKFRVLRTKKMGCSSRQALGSGQHPHRVSSQLGGSTVFCETTSSSSRTNLNFGPSRQ